MPQGRTIPKNKEAEQLVLGSILMDPEDVVPQVVEKVKPGYFYWKEHRLIFRAVL